MSFCPSESCRVNPTVRTYVSFRVLQCDRFNLHFCVPGKGSDLEGGSGRERIREKLPVDFVHGGKISDIGEQNGRFCDMGHIIACLSENGLDVFEGLAGLFFDIVRRKFWLFAKDCG